MRKLHYILIAMLALGCTQDPTVEATTNELVEVDFTTSGSITRTTEGTTPTTEDMQFSLISSTSTTGAASSSCTYTYNSADDTFARADGSTGLFANNGTYYLRIAAPASEIVQVGSQSYYGHIIERNTTTPLYISDPITVYVDGIVITTGGTTYIHDLEDVTLYQQRSKVCVSFKCAEDQDSRTVNTLYYKDVYAQGYSVTSYGTHFNSSESTQTLYSFSQFPSGNTTPVVYTEDDTDTFTLVPTTDEDAEQETTYFVSADYSESGTTYPVLVVGLKDGDDDTREVNVPLNINMESYKQYDYEITISSVVLTVDVSVSGWDKKADDTTIGSTIASFKVDIATGEIAWATGGADTSVDDYVEVVEPTAQTVDFTEMDNSNCYILNPASGGKSVYYIPISRIDDFWSNSTYVQSDYERSAYKLSSIKDDWEVVMSWHDFNNSTTYAPINNVTFEKGTSPNTLDDCVVVTIPSSFADPDNHCNIGYVVRATAIDGNPVLWSWHLWITDYDPYGIKTASTEHAGFVYDVTGGELHRYDNAYFKTDGIYENKLIMDRNLGARSADFVGHGSMTSTTATAPGTLYYQFGRKDPFPAYYNVANGYIYGTLEGTRSFEESVQNPSKFITSSGDWCNEFEGEDDGLDYIWNDYQVSTTNYTIGKSIFDPSPQGFRLPIYVIWTGFTGSNAANETNPVYSYTFLWTNHFTDGAGDYGYGRLYNGFAYYPALGVRLCSTANLSYVGSDGNYGSASPRSDIYGYALYFYSGSVTSGAGNARAHGIPVRPIQE